MTSVVGKTGQEAYRWTETWSRQDEVEAIVTPPARTGTPELDYC